MGARKTFDRSGRYNFTDTARILTIVLLLVAVVGAGIGLAPATAAEDASTVETGPQPTTTGTFFFDDEPDFTVEAEDATVESGSTTTVDLEIEPNEDSGFGRFVPRNEKINWFDITIEYDDEKLDFEGVAGSQVGEVTVTEDTPGQLTIENGYEFGDFFLDPDKAPATLAELEFSASSSSDAEVSVTPTDDSTIGWGPPFLKYLSTFQHDVEYNSGTVTVVGGGNDGTTPATTPLSATNTGGFISFDTGSESAARSEGISFPEEGVQIEAEVNDDGTWESTNVEFPTVTTSGIEAQVSAPNGLQGEINPQENVLTAEGELEVSVLGDAFSFSIATTTGDSGALSGSADLSETGGSATLVDNEYVVSDTTGNILVDSQLGLPIEESGQNWLELPLSITIEQGGTPQPPETGTLEVSAADQDGAAIEGATVTVDGQSAQTDASGVATFSNLEAATYDVTVEAEGESAATSATVEAGTTTTADVTVELPAETGTLEVEVTDQNGNALDATVSVGGQSSSTSDGVATFELAAGDYEATVEAAGQTVTTQATVEAGTTTTADVTVEVQQINVESFRAESSGGFISFDESTLDSAIAEGLSFPDGSNGDPIVIEATVNDDGTWESTTVDFPTLNTASDGSGFDAQATAPNGLQGQFDPATGVATAEGTLKIQLPLTGDSFSFDIAMTTQTSNGAASEQGLEGTFDVGENSGTLTFVDNEYTVPTTTGSPILNSRLGLPIEEPGLAWIKLPLDVDVDSGSTGPPTTGTLEVSATDQDGAAIEGATVTVDGQTAQTDASGVAAFSNLEAATYDVTVEAEGESATTSATVEAGTTTTADVTVELPPETGTLEVEVTDQNGDPIQSATVSVADRSKQTTENGFVEFAGLEAGGYDVTVGAEGESTTTTAQVEANTFNTASVTLELPPETGALEVSVTDQDGAAIEGATVSAAGQSTQTDASGVATFSGLEVGSYDVTVEAEGQSVTGSATVEAGSTATVSLSLEIIESYSFTATNTGGFISFNEETLESAQSNGISFPTAAEDGEGIVIEGQVEGDQWESTNVSFPTLTTSSGFDAEATAPNGLQGTIDRENDVFTASGTLKVSLPITGDSFQFEVNLVSSTSNGSASEDGLQGSTNFADNSATLVDNEYTVEDESGNALLDGQLGLPLEDPGLAWLELPFELEFSDQ